MNWLVWIILLAPLINWAAFALLGRDAVRRPYITALVERAVAAFGLAVAATIFALLAIADAPRWIDEETVRAVGAIAVVLISVPAVLWLAVYARGGFR